MKKKEKEEIIPKNYCFFIKNIPKFIHKLTSYSKLIYEEIKKRGNINNTSNRTSRSSMGEKENRKTKVKSVIDEYTVLMHEALEKRRIFYPPNNEDDLCLNDINCEDDKNNDGKPIDIPSEFKEIAKHTIKKIIL